MQRINRTYYDKIQVTLSPRLGGVSLPVLPFRQAGKWGLFTEEFLQTFFSVDFDTLFLVFFIIKNFYPEQRLCLTENTVLQIINIKSSLVADSPETKVPAAARQRRRRLSDIKKSCET